MIVIVIITFKPGFDERLYKFMKNHGSILLFTKTRPHCLKRSLLIFGGGLLGLYACCLFKEEGFQVVLVLVHCCTLSLCYFGAETGYRVATPYMAR